MAHTGYQWYYFGTCNTLEDVKALYRSLIKVHHPDKNADKAAAEARTKEINAQYRALVANFAWEMREQRAAHARQEESSRWERAHADAKSKHNTDAKTAQDDEPDDRRASWTGYSSGGVWSAGGTGSAAQSERNRKAHEAQTDPEKEAKIIEAMKVARTLNGATIERIGDWLWIAFNAKPDDATRDRLKAAGFAWSGKHSKWYFAPNGKGKRRGSAKNLDEVRAKYGTSRSSIPRA